MNPCVICDDKDGCKDECLAKVKYEDRRMDAESQ